MMAVLVLMMAINSLYDRSPKLNNTDTSVDFGMAILLHNFISLLKNTNQTFVFLWLFR